MITQMKKYTFFVFHRDYEPFLEQLRELGVETALPALSEEELNAPKPLEGMTICVTGTLEKYDRVAIKETIERYGGKASSSVSKKTTRLLVGEAPGDSKVAKARELGVPEMTEQEFETLIAPAKGDAIDESNVGEEPRSLF